MASLSRSLEDELNRLLTQTQTQSSSPSNQPKIQKVPPYLRERSKFRKYYFPKVVSIGPIHHSKGEEYKKMWAANYLKDKVGQNEEDAKQLLGKIRSQIKELKNFYTKDAVQGLFSNDNEDAAQGSLGDDDEDSVQCSFGDRDRDRDADKGLFDNYDKLSLILFVDGCASLHFMQKMAETKQSELQALDIIVQQDLLLLENQLPYKVLKILSNDDSALPSLIQGFIKHFIKTRGIVTPSQVEINEPPAHLLDALITVIVKNDTTEESVKPSHDDNSSHENQKRTHRNIQELITSGIKIRNEGESLTSISFKHGTLSIPPLRVDDFTFQTFMNMMAYEMCPDFKSNYEISNYVSFLNSLIDHADDVKVLRKAGVINNYLGSDEEVAHIFNTASTDFVVDTGIYDPVHQKIESVYKHKTMIWFTELRRKHFNTPWSIIGLISAILGFILTTVNLMKELGPKKQ